MNGIQRFLNFTVVQAPIISTTGDTIWYFNGLSPSGYPMSVVLTSDGGSSTIWTVVAGANKVSLSTSTGASTTVTSSGSAFSSSAVDIEIKASVNGVDSLNNVFITSRTPTRLVNTGTTTVCDPTYGYETFIDYTVQDNLMNTLPSAVGIAEDWTTGIVADYAGTTWRRDIPRGYLMPNSIFVDDIGGEASGFVPTATCAGLL